MKRNMIFAESRNGGVLLPVLVAILAIAVGVQSYLVYKIYQRTAWSESGRVEKPSAVSSTASQGSAIQSATPARPNSGSVPLDPFAAFDMWNTDWDSWDPFREMERMREQMDRLFQSSLNRFRLSAKDAFNAPFVFSPEMDLSDVGDAYVVRFDLPGLDKSKVSVKLEDRVLTVEGSTSEAHEEKMGGRVIRMERRSGQFSRSITLPGPVRAEDMKAEYENGVLTVRIPKAERQAEQKVITL